MESASLRYYTGLIRDLNARNKSLTARVVKLEEQLKKLARTSSHSPSNAEIFYSDDINRGASFATDSPAYGGTGRGFSADEIKDMVAGWIRNGQLPISIHDHTDSTKGGDAYANKGAGLQ